MSGADERAQELKRGGWRLMAQQALTSPGWAAIGIVASLLWVAVKIATPLMARAAIDDGIGEENWTALIWWTIAIAAAAVIAAVSSSTRRYAAFALSLRAEANLRSRMFQHLQGLHFGYHDVVQVGDLMARANLDLKQIQLLLVFIPVSGANLVMVGGITLVLFLIDPILAIIAIASLPVLAVAARQFSIALHPVATQLQAELADTSHIVEESVSGIRAVKGYGAEEYQTAKMADGADRVYDQGIELARLRSIFNPLLQFLPTIGLIGVLWFGGHQVINGDLSIGDLVAFNFYIMLLIFPLRMTSFVVAQISRASASASRVWEVLGTDPAIADPGEPTPLPEGPGAVDIEGAWFGYVADAPILRGLDLHVAGGETVALVGETGSGKSTVSRLIPRFYDVDEGRVVVDGIDITELPLGDLRRAIGMVFEDTFLFTDTITANIAFARPDAGHDEIANAARLAGIDDFVTDLPDGYNTLLGESGYSLSGGQRQRIALARAVLADPRILILDDATSAVDPTKEHEIRAALDEVTRDRTTVIIAHRPATITLADRVLVIEGGRIVEEGTHESLLAESARYRGILAHASEDEVASHPEWDGTR
jgi:ATP-binding cassette subfamily B protein